MLKKISFLLILISILKTGFSQEQINYENPQEYEIAELKVSGIKYLDKSTLVQISGLQEGQKIMIPGDEITNAVKKFWEQKMFSDVSIRATKIEDGKIWLEVYLQERPRVSGVFYFGIKNSDKEELNTKLNLAKGKQINDDILVNSENIIKNYFSEKGFSRTSVLINQKTDTAFQNAVILNIYINKHKKTKIDNINLENVTVFTQLKFKRKLLKETKEKRFYGLFKPSKYIKTKYTEDKLKIIEEYNKLGYRDARIIRDSVFDSKDGNVSISIKMYEGKQYFFRNISWIGNTIYPTEILNANLKIKKGDVYDEQKLSDRLNMDEDAVGNLYMDNGYLFFNVTPVETKIEGDSVDIQLVMYEGQKARINNVIITGNDRTNDVVIRRELRTLPGELFSKSDIIRSVREIANLGHFDPENIIPTPIPNPSDGSVDIQYALVERGNDRVEISGGWGQGMLVGSLGLSFNNFSIQNFFDKDSWRPLPTGDGQQLSLRAQTNGSRYQYYSVSFTEPWLGGRKPNSLSVSLYYNLQSNYADKASDLRADAKILGSSVGLGRRLKWPDDFFTLYNAFGYQQYNLKDWAVFRNISNGIYNNFTFSSVFGRNSVDNPLYARSGSSFSLGIELTPPYSLFNKKDYTNLEAQDKYHWIEYHKWTFKSSWFTKVVGDLVLNTRADFGYLGFYNKEIGYSPLGGFSLGGDGMGYYSYGTDVIGLRGYKNGTLTPSEGGNMYVKYSLEMRYPVVLSQAATIYGLVFVEGGNAWSEFRQFNPFNIYRSAGAGVRIFLPMLGLIGLDWGYGFDNVPGEAAGAHGGEIHFVMGQQF
jgi:outer membrane protein insertion porin family